MQPTSTGYLLEHVSSILHRQSDQVLQERLGIGLSQLKILELLIRWPQTKQRGLATFLGQTEASVSRQVALLQQKGLLLSQTDPQERRRHIPTLTTKGMKLTLAARDVLAEFHDHLFGELDTRQRDQLHRLLNVLHDYACAPGKRLACDRPGDIETLYEDQSLPDKT